MSEIIKEIQQSKPEKTPEQKIDDAIARLKKGDDGAHWESDVIEAAKNLYQNDKPLFQRKRSELKSASKESQITEWMKEINQSLSNSTENSTIADDLVTLVTVGSELFHNCKNECYVTLVNNNHAETWALDSSGFFDWLGFQAFRKFGFVPSEQHLKQAITTLAGLSKFEGQEHEVFLRCANFNGGYTIDLCNEEWQSVIVTEIGWKINNQSDVKFIRSPEASALPVPILKKGNIELLWKYVNIPEKMRPLVLAFILESWRPDTPYTILIIVGEQGSSKSSTHKYLRQISDPNNTPLRSAPKTVEDIYVSAANNHQASFDNMSKLSDGKQDALCTLATGGGYATRKHYSNNEEFVIEVKRPVIINGIDNVATRPDLIDRSIVIHLPKISSENKKKETELENGFKRDFQVIFSGLLDLFSSTLNILPTINIKEPPRMVDFAYLGEAMNLAMNNDESFNEIYKENRRNSLTHSLDSSPAALALMEMMSFRKIDWEGTYKELKLELERHYHQEGEGWPKSPKGLSNILKRMAPALREQGLDINFKGHQRDGWHVQLHYYDVFLESEINSHTVTQSKKNISVNKYREVI